MRLSFQHQVLVGIAFSIVLVFVVGLSSYNAIKLQQQNAEWVDHTREVISTSSAVRGVLLKSEANVRGFILANNSFYEKAYREASESLPIQLEAMRKLVSDNAEQAKRVDTLASVIHARLDIMEQQYELAKTKNYSLDSVRLLLMKGRSLSSQVELNFKKIENVEEALLAERERDALTSATRAKQFILGGTSTFFLVIFLLYYFIRRTYLAQKASEKETLNANKRLEELSLEDHEKNWILNAAVEVSVAIRGEPTQLELAKRFLHRLVEVTDSLVAAMYLTSRDHGSLELAVSYGIPDAQSVPRNIMMGEGLLGQMAKDNTSFKRLEVSDNYFKIKTATGSNPGGVVFLKSIAFEGSVVAVIEIGFLREPGSRIVKLLDMVSDNVAVAIAAAHARQVTNELLEKTQLQAEELETQQEELRVTNEELTRQTSLLQVSEEELRVQQEELKQINTELEEKAVLLEEQKNTIEEARDQVQLKADELERSGKFKSEFLANMSHELRTPLNSILILSRILGENKGARLNEEEAKYASVIYNSGNDLLTLINDILDLAKVEAGKVELMHENVKTELILSEIRNTFQKVAENKSLNLKIEKASSCPESLYIDHTRLLQILRNLLSNAIKFTSAHGTVSLTMSQESGMLHFEVSDTGIGIPLEKQQAIFEAFQQADGSTSRKFGGTGLGLSISRELAQLFGGSISLKSEAGVGSVFTLKIPVRDQETAVTEVTSQVETVNLRKEPASEKGVVLPTREERLLLIEDDPIFAADMLTKAKSSGFEVMIAEDGRTALELAATFNPTAIILDMHLPDMSGEEVLKKLKSDPTTRLIPVHTVSAGDHFDADHLKNGAIGFMQKPVDKKSAEHIFSLLKLEGKDLDKQRILLVEDDTYQSKYLGDFLASNNIFVLYAYSAEEALSILTHELVHGIILDIRLADMNGLDLLDQIKENPGWKSIPVVVNTAEDLSQADLSRVMKYAHPIVMKTRKSNERLLDEVKLFLRKIQPKSVQPEPVKESFSNAIVNADKAFIGKKILVADDDMRNIFALSAVLEEAGFTIEIATNGREAIEKLAEVPGIELVLMDVMMPEMDGIEATKIIRQNSKWANLPIIAVTAKAMQGDREQCLAAGANDYISKPVDVDKLLSLIKVWLQA
ncbi:response regulator [Dyadobacter bucti]|uniref:hybrid sensor histidine kinase/response regulator n=1 Tax=Dyadobacter bucti TaxID=2572203 RepID=UPI003F6FBBE1